MVRLQIEQDLLILEHLTAHKEAVHQELACLSNSKPPAKISGLPISAEISAHSFIRSIFETATRMPSHPKNGTRLRAHAVSRQRSPPQRRCGLPISAEILISP